MHLVYKIDNISNDSYLKETKLRANKTISYSLL